MEAAVQNVVSELKASRDEMYEKRCRTKEAKQQEQQPNDLERLDDQQIKQHIGNLRLVFCPPDAIFYQYIFYILAFIMAQFRNANAIIY